MNERHIAHSVITALDDNLSHLPPSITKRLHAARQHALSRQRVSVQGLSLAAFGNATVEQVSHFTRSWAVLAALALFAAGAQYWSYTQRTAELEEVDSALLSDDLPIDAYLDRGFDAWLKDSAER